MFLKFLNANIIIIIMFIFPNTTIHDTDVIIHNIPIVLKKDYTKDKSLCIKIRKTLYNVPLSACSTNIINI